MPIKIALSPQLKVTTQMVLGSHLLRLAEIDLEHVIACELVENPALERVESEPYQIYTNEVSTPEGNGDAEETDPIARAAGHESSFTYLIDQARLIVPCEDFAHVAYLIYSLNEHGFLVTPREDLAHELCLGHENLDRIINWLQQLDPPGIGARDVHECLILQSRAYEIQNPVCQTIHAILDQAWEPFTHQRWQIVARTIGCSLAEVHGAVCFMQEHFYLFPLLLVPMPPNEVIPLTRPDIIVRPTFPDGATQFEVEVPAADRARLRISALYYRGCSKAGNSNDVSSNEQAWIQAAVERGRRFIDALEQRYATLRLIGEFLVTYQADFFRRGPRHLKPLTRADAAHELGIHPSTVSRAVSEKVLQLPNGRLMELEHLFDTTVAAREAIRELVATRSGSLTDQAIAVELRQQSFDLSRRTVAKYRSELGLAARNHR